MTSARRILFAAFPPKIRQLSFHPPEKKCLECRAITSRKSKGQVFALREVAVESFDKVFRRVAENSLLDIVGTGSIFELDFDEVITCFEVPAAPLVMRVRRCGGSLT
jgi:hypothetical protein